MRRNARAAAGSPSIPHAFGGDGGERRRDGPDRRDRPPRQPEAERRLEANAAERAQGVVGEHAGDRRSQATRAEDGEAPGGIDDRRDTACRQLAQWNGEGVDGEVAGREVGRERRAAKIGHVEPDAGDDHAPGPALGVEGDEGAAEPRRHAPREIERTRGDRDVEVDPGPRPAPEPRVAHRPAHEHGRAVSAREGGDLAQNRDLGARQPLEAQDGHGRPWRARVSRA